MKIYKNLYPLIISPENLFRAWKIFKDDKRNKPDVARFERDLEQHIFRLHRELRDKTYRHGPYYGFWICDPKQRRIHKATVRDRVLHHAIFRILNPIFEPTFIATSFSCRVGKGTHKGVKKIAEMLRAESINSTTQCYALKCDVRKFFDSVDHTILLNILEKKVVDEDTRWLLRGIVDSYVASTSAEGDAKGIPIGNLTSQLFANVYMNEFDQFVKHNLRVKRYARYTDDFVFISKDSMKLQDLLPQIKKYLQESLHLELHPNKVILRKFQRGIDFLGYVVLPEHIMLRTKTKHRMFKKLKERVSQYKNGVIDEESFLGAVRSYLGVLSHADAFQLSEEVKNKLWFWLKS